MTIPNEAPERKNISLGHLC
jgi:hypothetical protein